jgi:probable HAF family extracellular repeat protein
MKSRSLALAVFAVTLLSISLNAQNAASAANQGTIRYKVVDLGTLGGPISYGSVNGDGFGLLNDAGTVASYADLAAPDPNASFFCYTDCFQVHAFRRKNGVITDLGAVPENNNSAAASINSRGWVTGQSQSSTIDPVFGIPEFRGVLWKQDQIIDLGTLDGGTESLGIYVNDAGQVVGFSTVNTEIDPAGFGFQTHGFIWQDGKMLDIGTLGGHDSLPGASCSHPPEGMVWGNSTTSATPNPGTGIPTLDPFLWDHGKMIDLGTLGGTIGIAQCTNNRREVIGMSNLPGDENFHAFFWRDGEMKDLGTLGGPDSEAIWFNDQGVIAGSADLLAPGIHDAVRWKDGQILDLGTIGSDACSRGRAINARGQVVGGSSDCHNFLHAFVWEEGGPMLDLNTLIPPGSGLQLTNAININDRGEILAKSDPLGVTPIDDEDLGHLVLLVPCDAGRGECVNVVTTNANLVATPFARQASQGSKGANPLGAWRNRVAQRRLVVGSEK